MIWSHLLPLWEVVTEALQGRDRINIKWLEHHRGTVCVVWWGTAEINIKNPHMVTPILRRRRINIKKSTGVMIVGLHHTFITESQYKKGLVSVWRPATLRRYNHGYCHVIQNDLQKSTKHERWVKQSRAGTISWKSDISRFLLLRGRAEGGATFLFASEGSCLSSWERSGTRAPAAE